MASPRWGHPLSEQHAALIRRYASEVIVCYDGDRAGQAAAVRAIELLEQAGCVVRASLIPDRLDPDEYLGRYGKGTVCSRDHRGGGIFNIF